MLLWRFHTKKLQCRTLSLTCLKIKVLLFEKSSSMLSKCCNLHQNWQHCETNKNTSFLISAFTLGRICGKLNELCAFYNLFIGRTDGILRNCYLFHHSFGKNVNWVYQSWFRILANDTFSSFPHRKSILIDSFFNTSFHGSPEVRTRTLRSG